MAFIRRGAHVTVLYNISKNRKNSNTETLPNPKSFTNFIYDLCVKITNAHTHTSVHRAFLIALLASYEVLSSRFPKIVCSNWHEFEKFRALNIWRLCANNRVGIVGVVDWLPADEYSCTRSPNACIAATNWSRVWHRLLIGFGLFFFSSTLFALSNQFISHSIWFSLLRLELVFVQWPDHILHSDMIASPR